MLIISEFCSQKFKLELDHQTSLETAFVTLKLNNWVNKEMDALSMEATWIVQETKEMFVWLLTETKNYLEISPNFALIDSYLYCRNSFPSC